ncbi:cell wall-binding repeat-containing protein [Guggenheimella bovis]
MKKRLIAFLAIFMLLALTPAFAEVKLLDFSLSQNDFSLKIGEKVPLKIGLIPSNSTETEYVVESSNESVASFKNGVITANGEGVATIWVHTKDERIYNWAIVRVNKTGEFTSHRVVIFNGRASLTNALVGQLVEINADPAPEGMRFERWLISNPSAKYDDLAKKDSWVSMPDEDLYIEAKYVQVAPQGDAQRIFGLDRIDTAVNLSKELYDSTENVIIARKDTFPDALSGSVLARVLDAPVLLCSSDVLDPAVAEEIRRLNAQNIYIIGGSQSISPKVESELSTMARSVQRVSGRDRYETSAKVASLISIYSGGVESAVIVSGENYPDALSISPYAARTLAPILLVKSKEVPASIKKAIQDIGIKVTTVVGGMQVIDDSVLKELPGLRGRIGGQTRFETSALIAEKFFSGATKTIVASGERFADALVSGPLAYKDQAPILLVKKNILPSEIETYLKNSTIQKVVIVGGYLSVSDVVKNAILDNLK